ncbi:MAG: flagellar biosynthesis repressor FlbT [Alphaproteobacteria bacterium]|nr:flagellar biosynthesis repressor FlbT [Alphaproteobacteria bacterium]
MPLKIVLKPGEKTVINQAVIQNGGEKAELILQNKASVLRERDIMTETEANSPAKRIYFVVQMLYMFPNKEREYQQKFNDFIKEFVNAVPSSTPLVLDIGKQILVGDAYGALKLCRKLISYEDEVLKHASQQ